MRKAKIKDDNGKLIEIDIEKFKKHLDEYHSTGSSLHEENGHYFTVDKDFRDKIDSGKYAELNVHPSGDYFFKLPEDLRNKLPTYIKENINLERFINA